MTEFWEWTQRISAVVALFSLPYLVGKQRRALARFSYDFSGSSGKAYAKDGKQHYIFTFNGDIKNHSLNPNTITKIYLVVWKDSRRESTLRFGYGHYAITDAQGNKLSEPLVFAPRESKKLEIVNDSIVEGTADEKILTEVYKVYPDSNVYLPKHQYQLAFEDQDGNMFDHNGRLISRELIDLNWTLENTFSKLKEGKYSPFIHHKIKIQKARFKLCWRKFIRWLGMGL